MVHRERVRYAPNDRVDAGAVVTSDDSWRTCSGTFPGHGNPLDGSSLSGYKWAVEVPK